MLSYSRMEFLKWSQNHGPSLEFIALCQGLLGCIKGKHQFWSQETCTVTDSHYMCLKEMVTHSSYLTWEIPCTEESGIYSSWGGKELDTIH